LYAARKEEKEKTQPQAFDKWVRSFQDRRESIKTGKVSKLFLDLL